MSLRKHLEKYQMITAVVCLALIGVASWTIVNTLSPRRAIQEPQWSYLYDEKSQRIYIGPTRDAAPLDEGQLIASKPETMTTIARVYVATCTQWEDISSRFVLFLSRYRYSKPTPEGDAIADQPPYVIRQEMAFPPNLDEWFDESDPAIVERNAAAEGQCEDARQIVDCLPQGPDEAVPKFDMTTLPLRPASRPAEVTTSPEEGETTPESQPSGHLTVEPEKPE